LLIEAKEGKVINTYPVDKISVKSLTQDYQQLYDEFGAGTATLTALRNKARLQAFYLDEKRAAIRTLQQIVDIPGVDKNIRDKAKLDLGDIYLLIDEPWEATLLYSQVEKSNKYDELNYLAKLKNASLNYYMGNFALAKSHLDVLKNATTKKIANDALDLSVLIKNNTILDTTDQTMQRYADIDLLIYQKKPDSALAEFKLFLDKYRGHSLEDEVLWQIANIYLEKGKYQQSLDYIDKLLTAYQFDILADDASYLRAWITDKYLDNAARASELYYEFITQFPGSMYAAEARARYRELRGDNIN
jgi:outer membrane protein assembly factor BamD (BamD/ComL family)